MSEPKPNITTTDVATQSVTLVNSNRDEVALISTSGNSLKFGLLNSSAPISFGYSAGNTSQGSNAIAVGNNSGVTEQGAYAVAVGQNAGGYSQGNYAVAIGQFAGYTGQGVNAVAIGPGSGLTSQGTNSVAIGFSAGETEQGIYSIGIGERAALFNQGDYAVAIGQNAGNYEQGTNAIAIGAGSGIYNQNDGAVAIGVNAGYTGQGENSVAIGTAAGGYSQGINSIAIGNEAGLTGQGQNSIAIGQSAGQTNQPANSIILNASGPALNGAAASALYINPVRAYTGDAGSTGALIYNTTTKEITYNTAKTFVIDHPVDNDKHLVHSCLEGPEAGIYYRGKSIIEDSFDSVEVKLPEYIKKFGFDFTINITPIFTSEHKVRMLCCTEVENGSFTVHGEPGPFFWTVYGKRFDFDVEPLRSEVNIKGIGPYTYI